jgi:hypothetical protein
MRNSYKSCRCCGRKILLMCEVDFCSQLCREGRCKHDPGLARG